MNINDLLSDRSCSKARLALDTVFSDLQSKKVVVFGCGNLGRKMGRFLLQKQVAVAAFADNNEARWNTMLEGVQVLSPAQATEVYGRDAVFVIAIWSPERSFVQVRNQLRDLGAKQIIHAAAIMLLYPEELLPYYHFESPEYYVSHRDQIIRTFNLLADEESRAQYLAHLSCRVSLDFDALPVPDTHNQYFPAGVVHPGQHEVFLDAGAYIGDTLHDFCRRTGNQFNRYIALEPDPGNFAHLNVQIQSIGTGNIESYPYAVGNENCTLKFEATGGGGAVISESGTVEVQCVRIDDQFLAKSPTFLKFDIEGYEMDALRGASKTIETCKPVVAVCIYHLPSDLWTIPLYISSEYPFYDLYVRTHQYDGLDFVLYAIPRKP